jgi:hypothetical protein
VSPRFQNKEDKNKPILKKAQELMARMCGILEEEKELDSMTLQQCLNMYKNPLSYEALEAITQLSEVAAEAKKKKMDKKKKKKGVAVQDKEGKEKGAVVQDKESKKKGTATQDKESKKKKHTKVPKASSDAASVAT